MDKSFSDNIKSIDLNSDEKAYEREINVKRGSNGSGTNYCCKDGTRVIAKQYQGKNRGIDVVLAKGKNYLHFSSVEDGHHGKLDVKVGNFETPDKSQEISYPMDMNIDSIKGISKVLSQNKPELGEILTGYVPDEISEISMEVLAKNMEDKTAFMSAFSQWKAKGR